MTVVDIRSPSRVAARLGVLAVVPFVGGAVLVWLAADAWHPLASQALSAYAAVVLSFIGAIHWGIAFSQRQPAPRLFWWGVIPSLVACVAVLTPPRFGLWVGAAMLVACYGVDRSAYRREGVAEWLPLRFRLTVVAVASCIVGAAGS